MEDPSYGGPGGRFVKSAINHHQWEDGRNVADFNPFTGKSESAFPLVRWIETLRNDFGARADRCVTDYKSANHPPVVKLKHPCDIPVKPGNKLIVRGTAKDPDGNLLKYSWWQHREPGTYNESVTIETPRIIKPLHSLFLPMPNLEKQFI